MGVTKKEYQYILEALTCIYTVENGSVMILLIRKETEPYKGYWVIPGQYVSIQNTVEEVVKENTLDLTGMTDVYFEEAYAYSNPGRDPEKSLVSINYLGLVNHYMKETQTLKENVTAEWFPIDAIPKMGYDHEKIIMDTTRKLRDKIVDSDVLKKLFPSDFTLPEIQKVYESILGKKFDRRNFRKKFILLGLIEDTNDYFVSGTGRPAKLYRFKEDTKVKNLF